jgi:hypothetical protein
LGYDTGEFNWPVKKPEILNLKKLGGLGEINGLKISSDMKSVYTFRDRNFIRKTTFDKGADHEEDDLLDLDENENEDEVENKATKKPLSTKLVRYLFDQEGFYYS